MRRGERERREREREREREGGEGERDELTCVVPNPVRNTYAGQP